MRQVNTRFFVVLLGAVVVLTAGVFGVHRLQAGNIAGALLWQVTQAEKQGKADVAARYLGRYLEFVPDDIEQRARLAAVLSDEKVAVTPAARRRAEFVINQVLTWDPQRHTLRQALCRIAIESRKLELAQEHLETLQAKLPDSGEVAYLSGQLQELQLQTRAGTLKKEEQDKLLQAVSKVYERAIKAAPTKVESYLRLAAVLEQLDFGRQPPQNGPRIDAVVAGALQNAPDDAAVLSLAARRAQAKGDTAAALRYLETGLKKNPTEPRLYQALARLHNQDGKRSEAIAQLRKGLGAVRKEHQFELTWTLANLLLDDEQLDDARQLATTIRDVNALSADYLEARCLMQKGLWYEAARILEKLRPAFKSVAELALQTDLYLGLCHQKVDEPVAQLAAYQRAVKADPTSLAARHGEAMALWALGQREVALAKFQALIDGNSDRPEAARWRLDYARMLLQENATPGPQRAMKVREELEAAEKDTAQAVECALLRAALLMAENHADRAEAELRRIGKEDPKRFEPWVALATLAMRTHPPQPQKAEQALAEAAAIVADSAEFRLAQIQFRAETASERPDALDSLEKGLTQFNAREQARLLEALAEAHLRARRPATAARLLRQMAALPQHAQDVRVRMQMLGLAMAQDDEAEMQRVLGEVKKIEGEPATEWSYGEALRLIWRARRGEKSVLPQARTLLNVAGARRPDWPAVCLARGEVDELEGKLEQAIASYRLASERGSRDPKGLVKLVLLLSQAHRYDEAEAESRKLSQFGVGADVGKNVVALLWGRRDYQAAAQLAPLVVRPESKNFRDHVLLGQVLAAGGRTSPEAEAAFRRAVALGEKQPEPWVGLVRYLAAAGQFDKALEEIDNAKKKLDDDVRLLALAACYEVLGALDNAELMYKEALAQQPSSASVYRAAADYLLRIGKPRDAEPLYRKLLDGNLGATDTERSAARRSLALALARGGDPRRVPDALQMIGLALDRTGKLDEKTIATTTEAQLAQARVLGALASHALRSRAIELLEALNQKQALQAEDQFQLARLLHQHSPDPATWQKARDVLKVVTTSQPNNARFVAFYANLLLLHKDLADAETLIGRLEQLEKDRKLPPGVLGSTELKARALEQRGRGAQAIALLEAFAMQKDALPSRRLLLAGLHGRLGNYQEAVDLCFELKKLGYREEAYGAAIGLLRAGKPDAQHAAKLQNWQQQTARIDEALRQSVQIDAENLVLQLQLADLMELEGRSDQVELVCRAILKKDANNLVALNNLAWLLATRSGQEQEALDLINRAIRQHEARPELLDTRAIVYVNLGKAREAVADLEKVVREAPTPSRYFHLTRAYHLAKDARKAVVALEQANALGLDARQLSAGDQAAYERVVPSLRRQ